MEVCVSAQPGVLFFGIVPGVEFYLADGFGQGGLSVEVGKELFVAYGVEWCEVSVG